MLVKYEGWRETQYFVLVDAVLLGDFVFITVLPDHDYESELYLLEPYDVDYSEKKIEVEKDCCSSI